jgi:hypothetical protein
MPGAMNINPQDIMGMQQGGGNSRWMDYEPNPNFGPGTNMPPAQPMYQPPTAQQTWANFNPEQMQYPVYPQQQPVMQPAPNTGWNANVSFPNNQTAMDAAATTEEKSEYSIDDFRADSPQIIAQKLQEALAGRSGLDSFIDAARIAHQQKLMEGSGGQQQPDVQQIQNDQVYTNMPSNTSLDDMGGAVENKSLDETLIENRGSVGLDPLDEINQAESLASGDIGDLKVLSDTPPAPEEKKKERPPRSSLDDNADVV